MSYKVMDSGYLAEDGFETIEDAQEFAESLLTPCKNVENIEIVDEKTDKVVSTLITYRVTIEWKGMKE